MLPPKMGRAPVTGQGLGSDGTAPPSSPDTPRLSSQLQREGTGEANSYEITCPPASPAQSEASTPPRLFASSADEESALKRHLALSSVSGRTHNVSIWSRLRSSHAQGRRIHLAADSELPRWSNGAAPRPRFRALWRKSAKLLFLCIFIALAMLGLVQIVSLGLGMVAFFPDDMDSAWSRGGKDGSPTDLRLQWPTDFTADILPIQCHSHNDYWRKVPLYEAIHYGCTGVEADVWLLEDNLFVGHTTSSLTPERTLTSLYINPLIEIIDRQNPDTTFHPQRDPTPNGVFDTDPSQSLILLIDFKTSGPAIFPVLQQQLQPLREKGYLSYWDGTVVHNGPITVVGTGNCPYDLVVANTTYRDIFFDAPLDGLASSSANTAKMARWPLGGVAASALDAGQGNSLSSTLISRSSLPAFTTSTSYYASISFKASILHGAVPFYPHLSDSQLSTIRTQIAAAHAAGLKVRYWAVPEWPRGTRDFFWDTLVREGADVLNADDLRGVSRGKWLKKGDRRGSSWDEEGTRWFLGWF